MLRKMLTINKMIITFLIILSSCMSSNQQSDKSISPSKKYYLTTTINSSDKSKKDYGYLKIQLFNTSGLLKSYINIYAGDSSKWAVGWDNKKDTIILFSSDIETYAWKINKEGLQRVDITDNIKQTAKEIKIKKYSDNR